MVRSKTQELDGICRFVDPNEEEIIFYVTFHAPLIDTMEFARVVLSWNATTTLQMPNDFAESRYLLVVEFVAFQVLLELARVFLYS